MKYGKGMSYGTDVRGGKESKGMSGYGADVRGGAYNGKMAKTAKASGMAYGVSYGKKMKQPSAPIGKS